MSNIFNNTVVGISTALGVGAISIVRLSGNDAISIVNKAFKGKDLTKVSTHTVHYGYIIDPETKEIYDEVLVTVFKAPKTFTREDIVEINCHGGILVTNRILELMISLGAEMAEPGEFTKRAFLNGRIDLSKAEAVMDMIEAKSKMALSLAKQGLLGDVKELIQNLRNQILSIMAHIAVNIDYPEYDDATELTNSIIKPEIESLIQEINDILKYADTARMVKEGVLTAIIGRPNVGKSSLLNALLRENKAIVTNIAGTTRDIVEGTLHLGGITLNLVDTAGIHHTEDLIEKIGVEKSKQAIDKAELILIVFDGSEELRSEDYQLLELVKDKKHIKVVNKMDLDLKINLDELGECILISSTKYDDIHRLEEAILGYINVNELNTTDMTYISNARHISLIKEAKSALNESLQAISSDVPIDFIDVYLQQAWHALGAIMGEVSDDDIISELFSKFCLGK